MEGVKKVRTVCHAGGSRKIICSERTVGKVLERIVNRS
jgi:hypothetical protein